MMNGRNIARTTTSRLEFERDPFPNLLVCNRGAAALASDEPVRGANVELRAIGLDAPPLIGGGAVQQSIAPAELVQQAQGIHDYLGAPTQFTMGNASVKIPTPAKIVELLRAGGLDATVAEQACKAVGSCSNNNDDRQACLTAGIVPALVAVLTCHSSMPAVAETSCRELGYIASCNEARQEACVAAGVLPAIVTLLTSHSCVPAVAEQACKALGKIVLCNTACKEACTAAGVVPALLTVLTAHSKIGAVAKEACRALENIADKNPSCKAASFVSAAVPALLAVLANHPVIAASPAQRTLLFISSSNPACREIFVAAGAVPVLVKMCTQQRTYGPMILENLGYNNDGTLK